MGTLDQLKSYTARDDASARIRTVAVKQGERLRALRDFHPATPTRRPAAPPPAPRPAVPTIASANALLAKLPESRYALVRKDGAIDFFEVKRIGPGRSMIFQLHGAPGSFRRVAIPVRFQHFAATHILEETPEVSGLRFAAKVGECARCGSPLTQSKSRERGYGPKCWEHIHNA